LRELHGHGADVAAAGLAGILLAQEEVAAPADTLPELRHRLEVDCDPRICLVKPVDLRGHRFGHQSRSLCHENVLLGRVSIRELALLGSGMEGRGGGSQNCRRRDDESMPSALRYFVTVRRAMCTPFLPSSSTSWSSLSGLFLSSPSTMPFSVSLTACWLTISPLSLC